jgi:hypothetical protein
MGKVLEDSTISVPKQKTTVRIAANLADIFAEKGFQYVTFGITRDATFLALFPTKQREKNSYKIGKRTIAIPRTRMGIKSEGKVYCLRSMLKTGVYHAEFEDGAITVDLTQSSAQGKGEQ